MRQKVMVGFPVGGSVHPAFAKSLLDLQRLELLDPSPDYELLPIEYSASLYVQENRNILVELARAAGADWLLQVDTDESFQPTLLRQLMSTAHATTRPIVFGLYSNAQRAPAGADGGFLVVDMIFREVASGEYENIVPPSDSRPFMVDGAGSGILLTHLRVFDRLPFPWFWLDLILPAGKSQPQIINEDLAFCRTAREAGFSLWCDPLAEAQHHKQLALLPSTFRHFLVRAREVQEEMRRLG